MVQTLDGSLGQRPPRRRVNLGEVAPKHTGRPSENRDGDGHRFETRKAAAQSAGLSERKAKEALRCDQLDESQRAMVAARLANMRQGERTDLEPCANLRNVGTSQTEAAGMLNVSESQRAMVAAKLANMAHGGDRKSDQGANLRLDTTSQTEAAELLHVSRRSVQSAKRVMEEGTPELITAVERGLLAVSEAAKLVKEDLGLQKDVLTKMSSRKVSASKAVREIKREQHKRDLAESQKRISADRIANLETVCDIRVCSCAELFASGIKPDAVITDPPYPHEFLPVFTELAIGCKESSVPMVAVMSGQSYLPEVVRCGRCDCVCCMCRRTGRRASPHGASRQCASCDRARPCSLFGHPRDGFRQGVGHARHSSQQGVRIALGQMRQRASQT